MQRMRSASVGAALLASAVLVVRALAGDPVVSAVTISQRAGTKLVDIEYTVTDPDGEPLTISGHGRDVRPRVRPPEHCATGRTRLVYR
jgi:hypothetical protein